MSSSSSFAAFAITRFLAFVISFAALGVLVVAVVLLPEAFVNLSFGPPAVAIEEGCRAVAVAAKESKGAVDKVRIFFLLWCEEGNGGGGGCGCADPCSS
jgi:hypothetical protein